MSRTTVVTCDRCKGESRLENHISRLVRVVSGTSAYETDLCAKCFSELCDWLGFSPQHSARLHGQVK